MKAEGKAKVLMVQGTSSHAGKSLLVTALCRIFLEDGLRVAPFKAQNMSLNSSVTPDGGEIGRAQAVQAGAAHVVPTVEMNPILLKPEGDQRSQVVVLGKPRTAASVTEYYRLKSSLWPAVTGALDSLRAQYDIVVIEGAGSPAEINLKEQDLANMRVARYADAPVLLVGDIERGGVFASLVGTLSLLEPEEQALVKGFVINKFRGDPTLLEPGLAMLRQRTGIPVTGVLPYLRDISIPEEDSLGLETVSGQAGGMSLDIVVVRLPHLANFDDFDPLKRTPGVRLRYISGVGDLGDPDLIILPGTKTTVADLEWLRLSGLAEAVVDRRRTGTPVVGICGGYQMLGKRILDPDRVESDRGEVDGLGLLPATTTFEKTKETHQVCGRVVSGAGLLTGCREEELTGYEIHMGNTVLDGAQAAFQVRRRPDRDEASSDGAVDAEGRTMGTYIHGLFHSRAFRRRLLARLAEWKGVPLPEDPGETDIDTEYARLAAAVREHLDMEAVYRMAGLRK